MPKPLSDLVEALERERRIAIFLHGKPKPAKWNDPGLAPSSALNFIPWASKQLLLEGWDVWAPNVRDADMGLEDEFMRPLDVLKPIMGRRCVGVGHSLGAVIWLKWLSGNPDVELDQLHLVDPWGDPDNRHMPFGYGIESIDPSVVDRIGRIVLYYSSDDENPEVDKTIEIIGGIVPMDKRDCLGYGHFMVGNTMAGPDFPELIEEVLTH